MEEVCVLRNIKTVSEMSHRTITNVEEALSEIAGAIGTLNGKLSGDQPHAKDLGQLRIQLSALTALVTASLQVYSPSIITYHKHTLFLSFFRKLVSRPLDHLPLLNIPPWPLPTPLTNRTRRSRESVASVTRPHTCVQTALINWISAPGTSLDPQ